MKTPQPIPASRLSRLNRGEIHSDAEILSVLDMARRRGLWLTSGMDLSVRPRRAKIAAIDGDSLTLHGENLDNSLHHQLRLNLEMDRARYFFAGVPEKVAGSPSQIRLRIPSILYRAERRDIPRAPGGNVPVNLLLPGGERWSGVLIDRSYEGLGVRVRRDVDPPVGLELQVELGNESDSGSYATVRHSKAEREWRKLGLAVTSVAPSRPLPIERRAEILGRTPNQRRWMTLRLATRAAATLPRLMADRIHIARPKRRAVEVVEYRNGRGERLRAIVDRADDSRAAPLVVIPPAWGRTKETLLPLAETIISTFRSAGKSVNVLRYDERNRRGESYVDPDSQASGSDGLRYTFSGAVEDIHTTLEFVKSCPDLNPDRVLLITVSLASVQGRRAVATDTSGLVSGWISVVGMPDLQSSMRAVTGGIDWIYGLSQGVSFGMQELVGVLVDMDNAGPDTLRHRLGYFEDARRDMAQIGVPITWIYGRHDGWMSLDRIQSLMSAGQSRGRRLIEVPTGHQLRTSREALETFQLVAEEAARILLGYRLEPEIPDLLQMERKRIAERSRRPRAAVDLRSFWHDYLLGRDETVGIELMAATSLYQEFLDDQIQGLRLSEAAEVLDLGAGTGELAVRLGELGAGEHRVTAIDFVLPALVRAQGRASDGRFPRLECLIADLGAPEAVSIPIQGREFDAALASLLVGYVEAPELLLKQVRSLLKPGGRIVISAPRRDADISKLFSDTVQERRWDAVTDRFGDDIAREFESRQAEFLNNAAKVLELEEDGRFKFYDPGELEDLLRAAGFQRVASRLSFGSPGQFAIASGYR